jgi:transcriptional regulator with XRE-family HTH domain
MRWFLVVHIFRCAIMQSEVNTPSLVSENVRYLLWKDSRSGEENRERWAVILAARTGISLPDVETILDGTRTPTDQEIVQLGDALGVGGRDEGLRYPLPIPEHTLVENVNYLLDTLEPGDKTRLANSLGIAKTTISRWAKGSKPRQGTLQKLAQEFGLARDVDLTTDRIYLTFRPVTIQKRRERLKQLIDRVDGAKLEKVIAAVELMVRET